MNKALELKKTFIDKFKITPLVVSAPGRINIIGEHTDYNQGYVLPAAIDKSVELAIARSGSSECQIIAIDLAETYQFSIEQKLEPVSIGWVNYFIGVLAGIMEKYSITEGFNMMFSSAIPVGSGLSSSAAIECGFGFAISTLYNLNIDKVTLAKIGQTAEHDFAGVKCGIMDQFAVVMGKPNQVIQLDCRSLDFRYYPADFGNYQLVLFDTLVKHNLASSEYNVRRDQCEEGVAALKTKYSHVNALRDADLVMLEVIRKDISDVVFKRCKYIIEENQRVLAVCEALENTDIATVGALMFQTHEGLQNEYQVSCEELDLLVQLAKESGEIIGARMMGGGFGGCTLNLIAKDSAAATISRIRHKYHQSLNKEMNVYSVAIGAGVHEIVC